MKKKYFQGKPIGYKVVYNPVNTESNFSFVSVNYTINAISLTDLAVYTMFAIQVSAVSSGGVGPVRKTLAGTG